MVKLSENALKICESRYFMEGENEDWEKCTYRVADHVASFEGEKQHYRDKFHEIMNSMEFIPAGRIIRNSGRTRGSLLNCHALSVEDNMRSILQVQMEAGLLWADGSGVGFNFSALRPTGDKVNGPGGETSGPVSFLKSYDALAATIQTGGSRRAAALACLDVSHPDIDLFLDAKLKDGILPHFNISINITNEFLESVEGNKDFNLTFNHKVYKTINARKLWDKIISNMLNSAEPGLLNTSNMYRSNSYYFQKIVSPNPCQPGWATILTPNGISTIGSINIGDIIWSEDGWVTVTNKACTGVKDVYKYRTTSSVFNGTLNHKVVSNKEKVEVDNANSIDVLQSNPVYTATFDSKYVMDGLVLGDGAVHKASNNKIYLCIGENDKDYFSSEVKDLIINHQPGISEYAYDITTSLTYNELPLTYYRKIPSRFFYNSPQNVCALLRGIFSANGSVIVSGKRISLKTTSKCMVEQVQILLSSIGIKSYYTTNKPCIVQFKHHRKSYNRETSYDVNITNTYNLICFRDCIGFLQHYKTEALNEIINNFKLITNHYSKSTFDIIEKQYVSTEEVFDITVNGNSHTYWSDGSNISNCSELPLPHAGSCCLGSLVLPKFITGGRTNWKRLEEVITYAVRFLDNIIDINKYTLPEIESVSKAARRIGVGYMGLAEYLIAKNLRYGSKEALEEIEKLVKTIRNMVYQSLVKLAQEKGAFPMFDSVAYGKADFIRTLPASLRKDIKKYGSRCCTAISAAPNGTIALIPEVTGGIEPLFAKAYMRKDRVGHRVYIAPSYSDYINSGAVDIPSCIVDSFDLKPEEHLETQSLIQRYIDSAVSKTINLPKETTEEQLSDLLLEYAYDLKGVTVYRDGSKKGQVLNRISHEEVLTYIKKEGKTTTEASEEHAAKCRSGKCDL